MESPSHGKVPKWLEDMSDSVKKHRPGSWKLTSSPRPESSASFVFAPDSQSGTSSSEISSYSNTSVVEDQFDQALSISSNNVSRPKREGSARHGRRAIPTSESHTAESTPRNSPTKSAPSQLEKPGSEIQAAAETNADPALVNRPACDQPSTRSMRRKEMDLSLEESWSSLSFFNKKHKGRLSLKLDGADELQTLYEEKQTQSQSSASPSPASSPQETGNHTRRGVTETDFIIPELPKGQDLTINIHTTWGDKHYVGLNGIEIYSSTGEPVKISKISADPADINILPEYSKDPRVVINLVDGVNRTRDDMHLWLAPFTPGRNHFIYITFKEKEEVAMIRIWNYNKSRIHSYRGAKDVEMSLDGQLIFRGEIARACGGILGGTEAFGDTILFTTDEDILENISQFDDSFNGMSDDTSDMSLDKAERPVTADTADERPFTSACSSEKQATGSPCSDDTVLLAGQKIEIVFLANWGHPKIIGLTGFEIIGDKSVIFPIEAQYLQCNESSSHIYRLIDGEHRTTDDSHMWYSGFCEGKKIIFTITFPTIVYIAGIKFWNYNKSPDLSYCGVKLATIHVDGKGVSPPEGFLIRRALGNNHFDFSQTINFLQYSPSSSPFGSKKCNYDIVDRAASSSLLRCLDGWSGDEYESPMMPEGFIFQILIFSTWGDPYYVGLNGLDLYDAAGVRLNMTEKNIAAFPESVNILEKVNNDVRTPDKLIDGYNDTHDGIHAWLAPILPNQLNRVYIVFDHPVTVSMIKLWNYGKTPTRGVKEFGILVDDLVVYNGVLDAASSCNNPAVVPYSTVLFTLNKDLLRQEKNTAIRNSHYGQDVQLLNEQQRITSGGSQRTPDQSRRPLTSVKPQTSYKKK